MFFDRPESGETSILVHISFQGECMQEDPLEFEELVLSAGGDPVAYVTGSRKHPAPSHFVGSGKLEEIAMAVQQHSAELVLFNHSLSPNQEKNLESALKCRVLDRTGLILDIFAQRARSHEGKLQVELAQLSHMVTRLKRGWTHLDRQKGGIGLKGAGETQLELDQRMIRQRIKAIKKSLAKVQTQREQGRRSRKKAEVPTISLVGYTNAGKSSLFNMVANADVYAAGQLFATLDSTLRRVKIPNYGNSVFADTVGFISHLPHQLVQAFKATLEETTQATILIHVIDAANEQHDTYVDEVNKVLHDIGADKIPCLQVYNKIDLLEDSEPKLQRDASGKPIRVWVSAKNGDGIDLLLNAVSELLTDDFIQQELVLLPEQGKLRAKLYARGAVRQEVIDDSGKVHLEIRLPRRDFMRILIDEGVEAPGDLLSPQSA